MEAPRWNLTRNWPKYSQLGSETGTARVPEEFRSHTLELPASSAGLRLDQALAQALPQYSRARLKSWIEVGAVQVEGRVPRPRDKVLGGERVQIEARLEADDRIEPEAASVAMEREDHHEHQQEEVGPWPFALGVVQAVPQIEDLQHSQ